MVKGTAGEMRATIATSAACIETIQEAITGANLLDAIFSRRVLASLSLAKRAHSDETPLTDYANSFDSARNNLRRELTQEHPDARVAARHTPSPTPATGVTRRERGLLLAVRTDSVRPAERRHRLCGASSPNCVECGAVETLYHLLSRTTTSSDWHVRLCRISYTPPATKTHPHEG
ncbi:hypothetical protein HPB51_021832 [Rhipicephalus microplus]|uniref:Tick transposon n=1 Tax=Rhipicephalus microplus TaxID=6941 RepID=A0A9J6E4L9_RHIMP|nr:hypothetical protein HPB51_021832 [Rhipicephalus microplus]